MHTTLPSLSSHHQQNKSFYTVFPLSSGTFPFQFFPPSFPLSLMCAAPWVHTKAQSTLRKLRKVLRRVNRGKNEKTKNIPSNCCVWIPSQFLVPWAYCGMIAERAGVWVYWTFYLLYFSTVTWKICISSRFRKRWTFEFDKAAGSEGWQAWVAGWAERHEHHYPFT